MNNDVFCNVGRYFWRGQFDSNASFQSPIRLIIQFEADACSEVNAFVQPSDIS